MEPITHYDVVVIIAVLVGTTIAALIWLAVFFERSLAETRRLVGEDQRLTKAVGALVLQEAEKIRALVREQP